MPGTFAILSGFLERYTAEVEGRSTEEITPEMRRKLRALARGELPEVEKGRLAELLKENRQGLEFLALEIKAMRANSRQEK